MALLMLQLKYMSAFRGYLFLVLAQEIARAIVVLDHAEGMSQVCMRSFCLSLSCRIKSITRQARAGHVRRCDNDPVGGRRGSVAYSSTRKRKILLVFIAFVIKYLLYA